MRVLRAGNLACNLSEDHLIDKSSCVFCIFKAFVSNSTYLCRIEIFSTICSWNHMYNMIITIVTQFNRIPTICSRHFLPFFLRNIWNETKTEVNTLKFGDGNLCIFVFHFELCNCLIRVQSKPIFNDDWLQSMNERNFINLLKSIKNRKKQTKEITLSLSVESIQDSKFTYRRWRPLRLYHK